MKLFSFNKEVGRNIPAFNSKNFIISKIIRLSGEGDTHVNCMHIGPEGVVGYHQAPIAQLFLVVQGEGWVRTNDNDRTVIKAGQAAFWTEGEWHESGSDEGMTVIVIESPQMDPAPFMAPLS